jgi:hypothetical protein
MHIPAYTANSVINALKANPRLQLTGLQYIKCPTSNLKGQMCCDDPQNCPKALNRKCKQELYIHRIINQNTLFLTILNFRFPISDTNRAGFIAKEDSHLLALIRNGYLLADGLEDADFDT